MINKISIIGGDLRLVKLSEMLVDEGAEVFTFGLDNTEDVETKKCNSLEETIESSKIIVGPIPFTSNGENINAPFTNKKILVKELITKLNRENINCWFDKTRDI